MDGCHCTRAEDFDPRTFDQQIFQTLGGKVIEAGGGRSRVTFPFQPSFSIPSGVVQGGIQAALIDEAMIVAVQTLLSAGEHFTTSELKVNFLRPASGARFTAEAEVLRHGRGVIYVEASLKDDQGRLVARASSSLVRVGRRE